MARFEVTETIKGRERIVATTRRENGAIHEADRQVQSTYENYRKHAERIGGWACQGPTRRENETLVAWGDGEGNVWYTYVSYRRVGGEPEKDYTDALYASLVALNGATL